MKLVAVCFTLFALSCVADEIDLSSDPLIPHNNIKAAQEQLDALRCACKWLDCLGINSEQRHKNTLVSMIVTYEKQIQVIRDAEAAE